MKLPKLYRLARSPLTHRDLEKSKIAQFLLPLTARFLQCPRHHKKSGGAQSTKFFPALRAGSCAPHF